MRQTVYLRHVLHNSVYYNYFYNRAWIFSKKLIIRLDKL